MGVTAVRALAEPGGYQSGGEGDNAGVQVWVEVGVELLDKVRPALCQAGVACTTHCVNRVLVVSLFHYLCLTAALYLPGAAKAGSGGPTCQW